MSTQKYTLETKGEVCDICLKPIDQTAYMITWMDGGNVNRNLNKKLWFRFKTMFGGVTGTAYDAHGQCAADVLSEYVENKGLEAQS